MFQPVTLEDLGNFVYDLLRGFNPLLILVFTLMIVTNLFVAIKNIFIKDSKI